MRRLAVSLASAVLLAAGCSHHESPDVDHATVTAAGVPLAAGEVRIVSADTGIDLALIHDSISGGLSPQTVAKIRYTVDTATVKGSGLAASIGGIVKSAVNSAVGSRMSVPLSKVKEVRYEGGRLQFEWNGSPVTMFDNTKVNGKPALESFRPEDAQRFVDAVRARKQALGQR